MGQGLGRGMGRGAPQPVGAAMRFGRLAPGAGPSPAPGCRRGCRCCGRRPSPRLGQTGEAPALVWHRAPPAAQPPGGSLQGWGKRDVPGRSRLSSQGQAFSPALAWAAPPPAAPAAHTAGGSPLEAQGAGQTQQQHESTQRQQCGPPPRHRPPAHAPQATRNKSRGTPSSPGVAGPSSTRWMPRGRRSSGNVKKMNLIEVRNAVRRRAQSRGAHAGSSHSSATRAIEPTRCQNSEPCAPDSSLSWLAPWRTQAKAPSRRSLATALSSSAAGTSSPARPPPASPS